MPRHSLEDLLVPSPEELSVSPRVEVVKEEVGRVEIAPADLRIALLETLTAKLTNRLYGLKTDGPEFSTAVDISPNITLKVGDEHFLFVQLWPDELIRLVNSDEGFLDSIQSAGKETDDWRKRNRGFEGALLYHEKEADDWESRAAYMANTISIQGGNIVIERTPDSIDYLRKPAQ